MQDIRYSDVNMGQQSKDKTSVLWWMTVQWWRVELCVGLTCILNISFILDFSFTNSSFISLTFSSSGLSICKPINVRKLSLSRNTESYSSNKLLNRWMISHCHSTSLVHNVFWYSRQHGTVFRGLMFVRQFLLNWCIRTKNSNFEFQMIIAI